MRYVAAAIVVVAFAACASGGGGGAPPAAVPARTEPAPDTAPLTLRAPRSIGAFAMRGRRDYPDPTLGTQFRYAGPDSLEADAYVYPADPRVTRCGTACADSAVRAEAAGFIELIPDYLRAGYFGTATVTMNEALKPRAGDRWAAGHHVALAATRDGRGVRSDYYLYLLRGYRVKLRATYPDTPARRAAVENLASELV